MTTAIGAEWHRPASRSHGVVNVNIMRDPRIPPAVKGLYAMLCTFTDSDREVHLQMRPMAERLGCSVHTAERYLKVLIRLGVIEQTKRGLDDYGVVAKGIVLHDFPRAH